MGGFKCLERLKSNEAILDCFHNFSDLFNLFPMLHIEKCKIFLNKGELENAIDYIKTNISFKHFEIYRILAFCALINDGDFKGAMINLDKCWELMLSQEPKNPELYYNNSKLFSRICDRRPDFLKKCEIMIDKALEFSPNNANYLIEKAYFKQISGNIEMAHGLYTKAIDLDVNNKESNYGIIYCQILQTKYKEALESIEFLRDIDRSVGLESHPKLYFYEAIVRHRIGESFDKVVSPLIITARNLHVKNAKIRSYTKYEYLINTDYDFIYEMAKCKIKLIM
jgi:tetratricopeptide (TPR) repeat protein